MDDFVNTGFDDLLLLHDETATGHAANVPEADDDFDDSQLKPQDASALTAHELDQEMRRRGKVPKGFRADDEKVLQMEFNREHEEFVLRMKKERLENRERVKKQAVMQRRRLMLEHQLREEQEEAANDHRLDFWLSLIHQNATSDAARIEVNGVSARAVAKALWDNTSLRSLDISGSELEDVGGAYIARMLRQNNGIIKLEAGQNHLGPKTCSSLAHSLSVNKFLRHLDLQSNPLTSHGADSTGFAALCDVLRNNRTLTSLNVWRCEIGEQGGRDLVRALEDNHTLMFLETGYNGFTLDSQMRIASKLEQNLARFQRDTEARVEAEKKREVEEDARRQIAERLRKDEEYRRWLEEEKQLRIAQRCEAKAEAMEVAHAEEQERQQAEQEKYEAERKAKEEAEAKKKKKAAKAKK